MKKYVIMCFMLMEHMHLISMESSPLDTIDKRLTLSSLHSIHNEPVIALSRMKSLAAQDEQGKTRLHYGVLLNDPSIIRLILEQPSESPLANIQDVQGHTPLHLLLANTPIMDEGTKTLDLCSLLITQGADPRICNKAGENALHCTVKHQSADKAFLANRPKLIELFVRHGVPIDSPNTEGETALHYLFKTDGITNVNMNTRITLLPTLLACGANPNATTHIGETPLHYSLKYTELLEAYTVRRQDAIKELAKHGAVIDSTTTTLETPLHYAFKNHTRDECSYSTEFRLLLARTLLKLGANPNAPNKLGVTPFYALVSTPCTDQKHAVGFLMLYNRDANPNFRTKEGFTPLHHAVCARQLRWVQLLVSHTAPYRLNATDTTIPHMPTHKRAVIATQGKTAFDIALELVLLPATVQGADQATQIKLERVNETHQKSLEIFTLLLKDLFRRAVEKVNESSNVDAT